MGGAWTPAFVDSVVAGRIGPLSPAFRVTGKTGMKTSAREAASASAAASAAAAGGRGAAGAAVVVV